MPWITQEDFDFDDAIVLRRIIGALTGLLAGFVYGWVLGSALFDPEAGLWLAGGVIGGILGLALGASDAFWVLVGPLSASAFGLYLGYVFASALLGEHLGGDGVLMALGGAFGGWRFGARKVFRRLDAPLGALLGALHAGFLIGWFAHRILEAALVRPAWVSAWAPFSILGQAFVVVLCALPGAFIGGILAKGVKDATSGF